MAGLKGQDPDSDLENNRDYSIGWLTGSEDRSNGVLAPKFDSMTDLSTLPLRRGSEVIIKKGSKIHSMKDGNKVAGTTYKVKVHSISQGVPAYFENGCSGEVHRPTSPKVIWAGTGGYWCEADLNEVL
jgi:hypothetical protein